MLDLTNREEDILLLMAQGKTNEAIARHLFIGHNTVKTHCRNIYVKLGVKCDREAIALAYREGLLSQGRSA